MTTYPRGRSPPRSPVLAPFLLPTPRVREAFFFVVFFQIDDQLPVNRKVKALTERAMTGDISGVAAMGLWSLAGAAVQVSGQDGVISRPDLARITLNVAMVDELAELLVEVGLWHGPGHDCARCEPVPQDAWIFHDWWQFGYDRSEQVRTNVAKRKELRDTKLIASVWARDCVDPLTDPGSARCRYCGVLVRKKDTRSLDGTRPQLDHVDPTVADGARNIVISCETCNKQKGQRTPAQAGMVLRPAPRRDGAAQQRPAPADPAPVEQRPDATSTDVCEGTAPRTVRPAGTGTAAADQTGPAPTKARTSSGPPGEDAVLARVRGGAGARPGLGEGSGQGGGSGSQQGQQVGQPPAAASGRRRRGRRGRRKSGQPPTELSGEQGAGAGQGPGRQWDAGQAPDVRVPGRFGSPWHGHRGAPPDPEAVEAATCAEHRLPMPCRKCAPQWLRDEGWIS